jgi:MFS family permease
MGKYPMPVPDDDATVAVIFENLKVGLATLFGTPIIRSLFIVGAFMFVAFGLWNVLLLPFSITVLGATEFEYGLQEGLTSVGFVIGSLLMARFSKLLPEPAWIVVSLAAMGVLGVMYANATSVSIAILIVALSGLAQPPSSVSRSVLLQRNTPREMRGRVFSAFYVMRDIIFLIGMAGAGLADFVDIRLLIIFASCLLFVSAAFTLVAPGLGFSTWGAAARRLRSAAGPGLAAIPSRPATLADFDRLAVRLGVFGALSLDQRMAFVHEATVRDVPAETKILQHGDEAMSAFFILDGSTTAGIPADDGYHGLSTMTAGDFFGEIGALTGSTRTADVVADVDSTLLEVPADALRATMSVPDIQKTVMSTMSSRLQRTDAADLPRLAGVGQAELRDLRTPRPSPESSDPA